ncbi:hypothetical protein FQA39_LY13790 [Lamprigera yunnana]|nr:hypothetical protein FQA39_LY13790 [Lamprigera yunnana]
MLIWWCLSLSLHFEATCYEILLRQQLLNYYPKKTRNLKQCAIPTLNLPTIKGNELKRKATENRTDRIQKRNRKKDDNDILNATTVSIYYEIQNVAFIADASLMINMWDTWTQNCLLGLRVGDLIHLSNSKTVRLSDPTGLCYVDTGHLDDETNLKQRQVPREFPKKSTKKQS